MTPTRSRRVTGPVAAVVLAGVVLRVVVMTFGANFDYHSYEIVGELQAEGENVYAWTSRYNYGPIWFIVLGWLWNVSGFIVGDAGLFRILIVAVLIGADLVIGYTLLVVFGSRAATFFVLSPISIIVTGFHNQFDNVAIAIGLAAVLLVGDSRDGPITRRQLAGLALLGLSITTKHVLFFLPLWLALRQTTWPRRWIVAVAPIAMFGTSFLPWIYDGWSGIYDNVIAYRSFHNAPLVNALTFGLLDESALAAVGSAVFFSGMIAIGWWCRRLGSMTALLAMLLALVVLAPGVANQFLVIPVAAIAVVPNVWFGAYTAFASLFLIADVEGLGVERLVLPFFDRDVVGRDHIYDVLVLLLATGAVTWRAREAVRRQLVMTTVAADVS